MGSRAAMVCRNALRGARALPVVLAVLTCLPTQTALGWGRQGHAIVGLAAQTLLCRSAAREVARLGRGETLADLGHWADDVRSQPAWEHSAPWHYVNIPDSGDPRNPPLVAEGDVITATERHFSVLTSGSAGSEERGIALRFVVHFVADIHQPLHVGRADDRGGNRIDVRFADTGTNLHSFWDTDVIRLAGLSTRAYAAMITARARDIEPGTRGSRPRDWAEQVFALRAQVYDFDPANGLLGPAYLDMAEQLAAQQLALAAAHLAGALNDAFCR